MKLVKLRIRNYRSIVDSDEIRIESLQAFVGENNAGKSNILHAIRVFLTPGVAEVQRQDFFNPDEPIIMTATFGKLSLEERKRLRIYVLGDTLIIEKHIQIQEDKRGGRVRPFAEYHGYISKPKDWWLSVEGIISHEGTERPNWSKIAQEHNILSHVQDENGRVNKTSYERGIQKLIIEDETIEFEEPQLGQTQALGLQPVLVDSLPSFHMLPAITDYSDEIDKRSSSTSFRQLMGDLAERIIKLDPRYGEIQTSLGKIRGLLNMPKEDAEEGCERLEILGTVENRLKDIVCKLMPSINAIRVNVDIDDIKDLFSRGVSIQVDDGTMTDVLMKGHGLQRCIVFALLQASILNQRGELVIEPTGEKGDQTQRGKTIIIAIEEPELYIHPQMQRLIYGVLRAFSVSDQIIYSTHAPSFVDLTAYEGIAVIRKESTNRGTTVCQCNPGVFGDPQERRAFSFISSFDIKKNQMFFAKKVVLVDGEQDIIALLATGRAENLFAEFPEEIGYTLIETDCKNELKKYMKLLNSFGIPYIVLHELDGEPQAQINSEIRSLLGQNKSFELPNNLETALNHEGHFNKTYDAKKYCEDPANIPEEFRHVVKQIFSS
jgi:putative ATP-dependent endonuclease of OLD family